MREYEGFCLVCKMLICASCSLNNEHTAHTFMSISDTIKYLRGIIDENIKKNLIKQQNTEEKLVKLKQTRLQIESGSLQLISNIEEVINEIIDHLKMRKNKISEIIQEFTGVIIDRKRNIYN
jgi:hypothetical protein